MLSPVSVSSPKSYKKLKTVIVCYPDTSITINMNK